jgi:ABC-2 type transport system ATP-binding protein
VKSNPWLHFQWNFTNSNPPPYFPVKLIGFAAARAHEAATTRPAVFGQEDFAVSTPSSVPASNADQPPAILAEGLTKQFGATYAVRDLNFQIPRGVIFGFIGPSGSGKTTAVRLLTGVYEPSAGRVTVLGQTPTRFSPTTRAKLGYMPQQFVLYPQLSVWENMNFAASLYGMGFSRGKQFKRLLDFVELSEHRHKLAREISGGMQRRLALATTLTHNPQMIFLDEPTASIDPVLRRKFWDYFKELRDAGCTLFITTQYVGEAAYCDFVGVMVEGRLLMVETPEGLSRRAFGGELVDLTASQPLDYQHLDQLRALPYVKSIQRQLSNTAVRLVVDEAGTAIPQLVEWSKNQGIVIQSIETYASPLDDVFVELVQQARREETSHVAE